MDYSALGKFGILVNVADGIEISRRVLEPSSVSALEKIGYSAVWVAALEVDSLELLTAALEATDRIAIGSGIANVWSVTVNEVAASYRNAESRFPGRFLLGVGAGHRELIGDTHRSPYNAVASYVSDLGKEGVRGDDVVLAALRGRMLRLAAERTAGALPAWMPLGHTRYAREVMGTGKFLGVVRPVVFEEDPVLAREIARPAADFYMGLANYVNAWKEFGFPDTELGTPASDELIDALVTHGSVSEIAADLSGQFLAGADHVAVYPLVYQPDRLESLGALAEELGIQPGA
ncbi:TIGR03620 family F420-dependent LLM class oxidoreductase [Mycobacteroides abscessus]|uniref:TIGR03620 family F420-dependent LLM class oxidoreductase n=1 Tax=Mycobacteroides abscessus TaxID=36809 RepID=UPI0012FFE5C5|nr:TIGR03620 family F420-dependent LLM class oxidoreductase [Mycobacteroides abscessus]